MVDAASRISIAKITKENRQELTPMVIVETCLADDYSRTTTKKYKEEKLPLLEAGILNVYMIYSGTRVIGSAEVQFFKKSIYKTEMTKLFIKEAYQKQGFGTVLFYNVLLDLANNYNIKQMELIPQPAAREMLKKIANEKRIYIDVKKEIEKIKKNYPKQAYRFKIRTRRIGNTDQVITKISIKPKKENIFIRTKRWISRSIRK